MCNNSSVIDIKNLSYEMSDRVLFENVNFSINPGDKIGLVGPNGVGKTTLLAIINGDVEPSSGRMISSGESVGLLPQDISKWLESSVYSFIEEVTGAKSAREEFAARCTELAKSTRDESVIQYSKALERYEQLEVSRFEHNLKSALAYVALSDIDVERKIGTFSGGQRTRIALAAICTTRHNVILLDEPTNNLDDEGVVLLERFIGESPASFLIVSHDRRFLRNATERIIELSGGEDGVSHYNLGYDEYVEARQKQQAAAISTYEQYEKEKKRLQRAARAMKIRANSAGGSRHKTDGDKLTSNFRKERAATSLAGAASGVEARLSQLKEPTRVKKDPFVKFAVRQNLDSRATILSVDSLTVSHNKGASIGPLSLTIRLGDRVLLQGKNGAGKSSLLNAIAGRIEYTGHIRQNEAARSIYMDQAQTLPLPNKSPLDNLRHLAPQLEVHDAINLLLHVGINKDIISSGKGESLSGGERAKVLLAAIVAGSPDLLLLDEPTNNLDIPTIEALEQALQNYKGSLLLVSHDRDFVDGLAMTQQIYL